MDNATQLQAKGIEPTDKRILLYSFFTKSKTPLSVSSLFTFLKDVKIHRATVFRIVKLFEEKNILQRVDLQEGESRFELTIFPHHHHCVCRSCGLVECIDSCMADAIKKSIRKKIGFQTIDHSFVLFGICKKCGELV